MTDAGSKLEVFRAKALGTNVNAVSLLATDYLNHFNEALMLAEMLSDMPDMVDEFANWSPKHYKDHFKESGIADRDLAIEAYDICPVEYRDPFESTISKLNRQLTLLQSTLLKDKEALEAGEKSEFIVSKCMLIRTLIDRAGGIINGQLAQTAQAGLSLVEKPASDGTELPVKRGMEEPAKAPAEGAIVEVSDGDMLDQADIDALFD